MMKRGCMRMMLTVFLVFVFFPVSSWGFVDWIKVIGPNASANGRGGTVIAIGDDPSGVEVNPALISETESTALETNLLLIFPDMRLKYNGTGGERYKSIDKDRLLLAPGISFAHKVKDSPWSWGLSMAAPDAIATDYTFKSKFYGSVNASSELLHLRFGPAVAYQITPKLSIGARIDVDYGSLDLRVPMGLAFMDIGQCDGFGVSASVGLFYKPRKNLSFGLYYESPTAMEDLDSKNKDGFLKVMTPGGVADFSNMDVTVKDLQFSQNFGIGVAYSPLPALRLSADAKYIDWNTDWNEMKLKFSGDGADAMEAAGIPTTLTVPLDIKDQLSFALGAEYFFDEIYKVSLGYHYGDDAMHHDNCLFPFIPAEFEHTLTCGFAMRPTKTVKIALAYMYAFVDSASSSSHHAYDDSLEQQLGLPSGALQSEYNNAKTNYHCQNAQISVTVYW